MHCPSGSHLETTSGLSPSLDSSPVVVEPLSPPVVTDPPHLSRIEYISDSESSVSGEGYRNLYYEHHDDNFDCSDDKDYVDRPVRKRKIITEKLSTARKYRLRMKLNVLRNKSMRLFLK